jgi:uncharacterized protein (TIGR02145 family)
MKRKSRYLIYPLGYILIFLLVISCCKKVIINKNNFAIVTDIDDNIYHTVKIGTQIWMVENLKVTHYRNGEPIPNISDSISWVNLSKGAYCDYDNNISNSSIYGKLYNWYAVCDSRKLAPKGWHIPSDAEWKTLITFLGGQNVAGGKLKEADIKHWKSPNKGATNETGFSAVASGGRDGTGSFVYLGLITWLWSSTENDNYSASYWVMGYYTTNFIWNIASKPGGLSIRCIKD